MILTLVRGLPGSGKSTYAIENVMAEHIEADMFHMVDDVYQFNVAKIKEAHQWCQSMASFYMNKGHDVVVSNTFTQVWEMTPYMELANSYGAEINVVECNNQYGNTHNVPEDVITKMRERWEDISRLVAIKNITRIEG